MLKMLESRVKDIQGGEPRVVLTGPYEQEFIEGWVNHALDNNASQFVQWAIVDCTEADLQKPVVQQ
ncbi:hypothetical protein VPHK397_0161 [Vibrio phage K397]|nr:hypothetical protein MYOV002v2_p0152 [Vibrio phage 144E46.1]